MSATKLIFISSSELSCQLQFFIPASWSGEVFVLVLSGQRLKGFSKVLEWYQKRFVRGNSTSRVSDAQAKAYMDSCSPTQGMTVMQRVKMRFKVLSLYQ
ncbi:hypothetical protein [Vibrio sp. SCSIO 43132]|uniref:hypothetical protein n=1 Tax=Vibrio sp. SCSIO 43132 TaxID=2779363 RepID=UPI001CAA22A6|nr:hypothetical protein [Vibrio sp. SCSIO 43132]